MGTNYSYDDLMRIGKAYAEGLAEGLDNNSTELDRENDELISRRAVIELWEKYHPTIAVDAVSYDKALRSIQSAQPKIVRCKDCRYSYVYVPWDESPIRLYCGKLKHHYYDDTDLCVDAEGFCYLAEERKTNG